MKKPILAASIIPLALVLTSCGAGTFTATGTLSLFDEVVSRDTEDSECHAAIFSGYSDIGPGAPVIIRADGKTIAKGELGPGREKLSGLQCDFSFTIEEVPADSEFYAVEISNRGEVEFSREELETGAKLSIGG